MELQLDLRGSSQYLSPNYPTKYLLDLELLRFDIYPENSENRVSVTNRPNGHLFAFYGDPEISIFSDASHTFGASFYHFHLDYSGTNIVELIYNQYVLHLP